jgi:hypothetical protein
MLHYHVGQLLCCGVFSRWDDLQGSRISTTKGLTADLDRVSEHKDYPVAYCAVTCTVFSDGL